MASRRSWTRSAAYPVAGAARAIAIPAQAPGPAPTATASAIQKAGNARSAVRILYVAGSSGVRVKARATHPGNR